MDYNKDEENGAGIATTSEEEGDVSATVGFLPLSFEESKPKQSTEQKIWFIFRCTETLCLVFLWVVVGYYTSIVGTTMIDFQETLHTSLENLGIVVTIRILGNMLGGLSAGIIRERFHVQSEVILATACMLSSLTNFLKPWSPSVVFLASVTFVEGFCTSCLNSVGNAMILSMWKDRASGPIHAFHFGYGLGSFCGPLIAKGYLSIPCSNNNATDAVIRASCNNLTRSSTTSTVVPLLARPSHIKIPFAVAGGLTLGCSFVFIIFSIVQKFYIRSAVPPSLRSTVDFTRKDKSTGVTPMHFLIKFIIVYMLLLSCLTGIGGFFNTYLFALAFESNLGFTKSEAAFLSSAYWASYTANRFVFSILAHFVSVKILLFVEFFATTGGIAGLVVLGLQSKTVLWIFSCFLGAMCSPIYPSMMSFIDRYIPVTGTILGIVDIGAGIVAAFNMWLAARLVEHGQGRSFLYLSLSYGCFACMLITIAQIYGSRHGDRHSLDTVQFSRLKSDDVDVDDDEDDDI